MATDVSELPDVLQTVQQIKENTQEAKAKLQEIIAAAQQGLNDLAGQSQTTGRRRGRPPGTKRGPGRPKGSRKRRKMSAAARARISAAQRKRWAAQKAGEKKK